jgi:putative two-component system response regulator
VAGELLLDETEHILFALAQAIEQRDPHMAGHCERLAVTSVAMGMAMQLSRGELQALYQGGYLHDIGKVGIPDAVLFKPGPLNSEEWDVMRTHAARGEEICRALHSLAPVLPIIRSHHECWDGSGYPDGLRGHAIPLTARVMQLSDVYDALISPRPYKSAYTPKQALDIMQQEAVRGWRDPALTVLFMKLHPTVISKAAEYRADAGHDLNRMLASLRSLKEFLDYQEAPAAPAVLTS